MFREVGPADEAFLFHRAGEDDELVGTVAQALQQMVRRILAGRDGQVGERARDEGQQAHQRAGGAAAHGQGVQALVVEADALFHGGHG